MPHRLSTPRRYRDPRDGVWRTQITQGEAYIGSEPGEVLSTVLGSCIAACIRDPKRGIGGMNHFLLPDGDSRDGGLRFGVHAMERLINALLSRGAARGRLEAKLFGGANVIASSSAVGWRNAEFAEDFLRREGIAYAGGDLRGNKPRRVEYWPQNGRARVRALDSDAIGMVQQELSKASADRRAEEGDVELF